MPRKGKNLTEVQKAEIIGFLRGKVDNFNTKTWVKYSSINEASRRFNCSRNTITRIWQKALESIRNGDEVNFKSGKTTRVQHKTIDREAIKETIQNIPMKRRQTIRSLAHASKLSVGTIHNLTKEDEVLKRVTTSLKPLLTDQNKVDRVKFCASKVLAGSSQFASMLNDIHIDEKLFYMTKNKR